MYPPFPPEFQLGPLSIHWYGITMVTAIFASALLASRYVARRGQDSDTIWSMLLWVVVPAIIGARLYYVFIQAPRGPDGLGNYLAHPLEILEIWQGGIHIYGALIGGGIALLTYMYIKKLPALIYLDAVGLALLPGQAIGRLGNFMNQELYGPPTNLPWGLRIDPAYRLAPYNNPALYPESVRFQPLFLYELIWNLIGFALIFWLARRFEKKLRDGDLVLMYLIWYPLGRFFLEFFRTDSWFFPGTPFDLVHLLSAVVIVASIVLLIIRHRNWSGRPMVAFAQGGSVAQSDEEEEERGGIEMSGEYSFMKSNRRVATEERAEPDEELAENEMPEDDIEEEESEGIEDIEDWDGESPEEAMILEEGEDYNEEGSTIKELKRAMKKEEEPEEEEEEEEEPEEEEPEEEEPEEASEESTEEAGEEESTEESEEAEGGEESEEASEEDTEGSEEAGKEEESEEESEESTGENAEVGNGEDSVEGSGEEAEESGSGEDDTEDETEGDEESSDGADDGDAGASGDE